MTDVADRPAATAGGDGGGWDVAGLDAFAVLGLPYSPDLTDEEVGRRFRAVLRRVHPDAGGDAGAAAVVTAAYQSVRSGVRRGELLAAAMTERGDRLPAVPERAQRPGRGADAAAPGAAERAALRERVAASRRAQGLPPQVTDPVVLARIADLMVAMEPGAAARGRIPRDAGAAWRPSGGLSLSAWRREGRRRFVAEREAARERGAVAAAGRSWWRRGWARVRYGRPLILALRVAVAAGVVMAAEVAAPGDPAVPALGVGAVTWLVLTGRLDLAPGSRR